MSASQPHIAIIGAGIIGLSCAWELSKRGAKVTVYEKNWPPRGASWAAAGMLAPAYEAAAEDGVHPRLFDLCMESAQMWAGFAGALQNQSQLELGYRSGPTLAVATTNRERIRLNKLREALQARGVLHDLLTVADAKRYVSDLGNAVISAVSLPTDGWVDNRACLLALETICFQQGVSIVKENAHLVIDPARKLLVGVIAGDAPNASPPMRFDKVLTTTGHHMSGNIYHTVEGFWERPQLQEIETAQSATGLSNIAGKPGRLIAFAPDGGVPDHVVRAGDDYLVPRGNAIIAHLSGIQTESVLDDDAFDRDTLTAGMTAFYPPLATSEIVDSWAANRPMTPDHAPLIGADGISGLLIASGHYRNGILLAPVTAKIMADMILDGHVSELAAAFSPSRFTSATA